MGKSNGSSQINNSDQYYQQMAGDSSQLMNQWNSMYLPMLQQYLPELQNTVQGQNTPLTQAAQAPVNAQTSRMWNTMQSGLGGTANPNALYSDMALQGNTSAGLAGDKMLTQAMSGLQGLAGMGMQGVGMGMSGLNNAAGGEGKLGLNLQQQSNAWIGQLLGAAGAAYGMGGMGGGGGGVSPSSISSLGSGGSFGEFSPGSYAPAASSVGSEFSPTSYGTGTSANSYYGGMNTQSNPISSGSTMGPMP